jgi:hypothetical protein
MAWVLAGLMGPFGGCHHSRQDRQRILRLGWLRADHDRHEPGLSWHQTYVTAIDAAHWLAILVVMGTVIEAFVA